MPVKFAILIDAGFLKRKLGSATSPVKSEQVTEFTNKIRNRDELKDFALHRIYYYDAPPLEGKKLKPLTGDRGNRLEYRFDKSPVYQVNTQLLHELKRKPFFAIRLGEVMFRGWQVKPQLLKSCDGQSSLTIKSDDLTPILKQTGVDLRIGLDIAALTLKQHVEIIVLVTGDADFVPAVKFARREGKQVFLYTLGHGVHPDLYTHADVHIDSTFENL